MNGSDPQPDAVPAGPNRSWLARRRHIVAPPLEPDTSARGQSSWRGNPDDQDGRSWRLLFRRSVVTLAALALIILLVRELLTVRRFVPVVACFTSSYLAPYPPLPLVAEDRDLLTSLTHSGRYFFQPAPITLHDVTAATVRASADEMVETLTSALRGVRPGGPDDNVAIVHLSVIGTVDATGRPCIVPPGSSSDPAALNDDTFLTVDRLLTALRAAIPERARLLVVFDATRGANSWPLDIDGGAFAAGVQALMSTTSLKRTWVLLPSSAGQESHASAAAGCSIWMGGFVNGMRGAADKSPYGDRDGRVEIRELASYLASTVDHYSMETFGDRQTPLLLTSADERSEDAALAWITRGHVVTAPPPLAAQTDDSWLLERWQAAERLRATAIRDRPLAWSTYLHLLMRTEVLRNAGAAYRDEHVDVARAAERLEAELALPLINNLQLIPGMRLAQRRSQLGPVSQETREWLAAMAAYVAPPAGKPAPGKAPPPAEDIDHWLDHTTACWHWLVERCRNREPIDRDMITRWLECIGTRTEGPTVNPSQVHIVRMLVRWCDPEDWKRDPQVFGDLIRLIDISRLVTYAVDIRYDVTSLDTASMQEHGATMRRAFDLAFVGGPKAFAEVTELCRTSQEGYEKLVEQSDRYTRLVALVDQIRAELPYLAAWWVGEQRHAARVTNDNDTSALRIDNGTWNNMLRALEQVTTISMTVIGRQQPLTQDTFLEVGDTYETGGRAFALIRAAYDADCSNLATHAPDSPTTLGAIRRALAAPLVQGELRLQLLRRADELDRRHADRARWERSTAEPLPVPDPRAATAGWITWRDLLVNPVLPVLGSDFPGASTAPMATADIAGVLGQQAAAARALSRSLPELIAGFDRQREAVQSSDPTATAKSLAFLARGSMASRRLAALSGQRPLLATTSSPSQRYLAAAWHTRLLRHAAVVLDEFWAGVESDEPLYCTSKARGVVDAANEIVRSNGVTFGDLERSQLYTRIERIEAVGAEFAKVDLLPRRLLLPAARGLPAPSTSLSLAPGLAVPTGVAAAWLSESVTTSALPVIRDRSPESSSSTSRLAVAVDAAAEATAWEIDPTVPDFLRLTRSPVVDLTCWFRGHRLVVGMPVAAADVPRTTTWQPGPDGPPRVTVRGETPRPQSVAVVFDCSGSMGQRTADGRTRLEAGRAALSRVIEQLAGSGRWRVSLWLYGHRTRWSRDAQGRYTAGLTSLGEKAKAEAAKGGAPFTLVPGSDVEQVLTMQELTGAVVSQIQDTLAPLEPGGETPLYLAISEAVGTDFGGGREDTPGYVLVVTDGANDQTGGRYVTAASVEDQIARLNGRRREPLRVDVIGFALAADAYERASRMDDVRNLATTTGGRFYEAADATSLVRALRESLRMLHWRVRGPRAPDDSLPLGSSVDLPVPPAGTEVAYDAMLEAGAVSPVRPFGVHAGDAIDLYATVGGRALEFRRYDGGTEQGIRDARSPVLDPLNPARRSFVAAHMAQRSGGDVRFPVSIQNADPSQFSPRPTEFWFEVRPLGAGGTPLAPFVFYDPTYQGGRTVPVLDLVADQWPAAATQAEIRGWFRFDTTAPDLTIEVGAMRPGTGRTLTVPNLADVTLAVSVGTPDATGLVTVDIVETHPASAASQLPRLRLTASGGARRATHVVELSSGRIRHEFVIQGTAAGLPPEASIAITDRQRIITGASALTADGAAPLRIPVPTP